MVIGRLHTACASTEKTCILQDRQRLYHIVPASTSCISKLGNQLWRKHDLRVLPPQQKALRCYSYLCQRFIRFQQSELGDNISHLLSTSFGCLSTPKHHPNLLGTYLISSIHYWPGCSLSHLSLDADFLLNPSGSSFPRGPIPANSIRKRLSNYCTMSSQSAKGRGYKPLVLTIKSGDASKAHHRRASLVSPPISSASPFRAEYGPGINSPARSGAHGQISETFYQLVASKPALDYSAFANVLKQLLQDASSISSLMKKETTRAPFILGFQEQAKSIIDFFTKLSPYIKQNPGQNVVLAKALLEGLVIPLFDAEYEDIFAHNEMLELITVALRGYYDGGTYSAPGLVTQLISKLTLFPDTNLLERFVAQLDSGELFGAIVKDQKYGGSLFEHGHPILVTWIDRLLRLSSRCEFDHCISTYQAQWEALTSLNSTYPQPTVLSPSTEGFQTQKKGGVRNLRKLTEQDKKSGSSKRASADSERITVPQETAKHFQTLKSTIPKTLSAARNTARQLEIALAFGIFEGIIQSFPCSNCCKSPVNGEPVVGQPGAYWNDPNVTDRPDMEECRVDGEQVYRMELKNLGLWRIVLSRQAMKDFSDARKFGHFTAVESKLRELATGNWDQRRSLTKKHINPDFPIPIKKAVYGDNGRIIWHVHLSFDANMDRASQVILGS